MAKTLIAFYSRRGQNWVDGSIRNLPKGNNEVIVEKIKALLPDADVFRIDTVKKYSEDYMVCIEEAKQELRDKARPELTAKVENMNSMFSGDAQIVTIYAGDGWSLAEAIFVYGMYLMHMLMLPAVFGLLSPLQPVPLTIILTAVILPPESPSMAPPHPIVTAKSI